MNTTRIFATLATLTLLLVASCAGPVSAQEAPATPRPTDTALLAAMDAQVVISIPGQFFLNRDYQLWKAPGFAGSSGRTVKPTARQYLAALATRISSDAERKAMREMVRLHGDAGIVATLDAAIALEPDAARRRNIAIEAEALAKALRPNTELGPDDVRRVQRWLDLMDALARAQPKG